MYQKHAWQYARNNRNTKGDEIKTVSNDGKNTLNFHKKTWKEEKFTLSVLLIKHHDMKAYGGAKV